MPDRRQSDPSHRATLPSNCGGGPPSIAGLCLGVFAFELTFTVVRRLLASQGLATGDRRHSYDLLARSAGNRDRSTLALWTLGAVSAGAGYASDQVSLAAAFTMLAVAFVIGTAAGGRLWRDATAPAEVAPTEDRR